MALAKSVTSEAHASGLADARTAVEEVIEYGIESSIKLLLRMMPRMTALCSVEE